MNNNKISNVTLIYPGISTCGFGKAGKGLSGEVNWIHHGTASIGAQLKSKGYHVDLIDMRTLNSWEDFNRIIKNLKTDIMGISISNPDFKIAMEIVKIIKKLKPSIKIIAGGLNPTIFPENYENHEEIDYIVTGEGEITFIKIIQAIENGENLPKINKGEKPNLDDLIWVDRTLFDYSRELNYPFIKCDQKIPTVTMISGRGCPYQCTYCQPAENLTYGKPYRMRSPENVIAELRMLKEKYNFKSITFWDDTFTVNRNWIFEFCNLYEKEKFGATIAACCRADIVCRDEKMIKRLSEIGVDWLVIGFESGSQRILDLLKKGTTVEQNYKAAEICKKYGIKVFATFMLGLPTETKEEQIATAKMIIETKVEHPSLFYFLPIKGTDIYTLCKEKDLILSENDDLFNIERTGIFKPRIKNIDYKFLDILRAKIYNQNKKSLTYLIKQGIKNPSKILPYLRKTLTEKTIKDF